MNPRCYGTLYRQNVHDMFRLRNYNNAPQGEGRGWGWGWGWGWVGGILTHTEGRGNQDSRPL